MKLVALLFTLTACYVDRVQVVTQIKWHRAPVSCLTLAPPEHPPVAYGTCWSPPDGETVEECERMENAKWSEYGKAASVWIDDYVVPTCYEAVGRAGGPQ